MLAVTVAPLALTILGFSVWPAAYEEYWYVPVAPCAALVIVTVLTSWQPHVIASALCLLLIAAQPARLAAARGYYPMPQYAPLVRGSARVLRQGVPIRRLQTTMTMPPLADETFPYVAMGGRFSEDAPFDAVIDVAGNVQFRPIRTAH
jgi:hypothetical protein